VERISRRLLEPRTLVWAAAAAYALALTAATVDRHRDFESGGYDLGIFGQGVWLLGQGVRPFSTVRGRDLLADHFQPALVLFAPLGALEWTPVALLVVQAVLLAAAAPALYALARRIGVRPPLALGVALLWLASPLTQWANLFDFHPESAVPLLLVLCALELERGRDWLFLAYAAFASCFKEDISLVFAAWGVLLILQGRRRFGLFLAAAGGAWFVLATQVAIPALGGNLDYYSERFGGERGSSLGAVALSFVRDPLETLGDAATPANAKVLLALTFVTAGLALLAPARLLPAVPPLAANLLSAYSYQHELEFHYYLVPAAVFAVASVYGVDVLQRRGRQAARAAPAVLAAGALVAAALGPASEQLRASTGLAVEAREQALALVPADASVAAAPHLVPHLANRRDVYQLPEPFYPRPTNGEYWSDAELRQRAREVEWVVYELAGLDPHPRSQVEELRPTLAARGFEEVFARDGVRVFRRR
jgi:uncharacterized membrane protein